MLMKNSLRTHSKSVILSIHKGKGGLAARTAKVPNQHHLSAYMQLTHTLPDNTVA